MIEVTCDYLETHGVWSEGLFRISGSVIQMTALFILITQRSELVTASTKVFTLASIHSVAALLKKLLTSTDAILPNNFGSARLKDVLNEMESNRLKVLHRVVLMCGKLVENQDVTMLNAQNLSICISQVILTFCVWRVLVCSYLWSPQNLMDSKAVDLKEGQKSVMDFNQMVNRKFAKLIGEHKELFPKHYKRVSKAVPQASGIR